MSNRNNYHLQILLLVLTLSTILFCSSWFASIYTLKAKAVDNINLFSDIIRKRDRIALPKPTPVVIVQPNNNKAFFLFQSAGRFTEYYVDSNKVVLGNFMGKLRELKLGKKRKVRIAFIGDSMIEGDMISQTIRKLMQKEFGGNGVGFVPIMSNVAGLRTTVTHKFSPNWIQEDFRSKKIKNPLFISGHSFYANGKSWCDMEDRTLIDKNLRLNKYLLTGKGDIMSILVNDLKSVNLNASQPFNDILVDSSKSDRIKISLDKGNLPVYGVSFESDYGVIIDNYSFRGASGLEFGKMNADYLKAIQQAHPYDLIILQYGVNLLNTANADNFVWYYNPMKKSVEQIKNCFLGADILMVSSADKAFRYQGEYSTARGMFGLISMQQKIAYESGVAFYNLYESMGGDGSIVRWVQSTPPMAYKDYTHPTSFGDEIIAQSLFEAFMFEFQKETSFKPH